MHHPPVDVTDNEVLAGVQAHWLPHAERVAHLPVGFGAHHWAAYVDDRPRLFLTLDHLGLHHDSSTLEATYAAAAALAETLPCVVPCLATTTGTRTVPFADGALSATPWVEGTRPADACGALALVGDLHATPPPTGIVVWTPLVRETFADDLAQRLTVPWDAGPLGAIARAALAERWSGLAGWTEDYHHLAEIARQRRWVPTHGEPHERNQLTTSAGLKLVDWESLRLAPPERDLRWLATTALDADADMLNLFDLEWRLDEISQYATWFEQPHGDADDDRTALAGLATSLSG